MAGGRWWRSWIMALYILSLLVVVFAFGMSVMITTTSSSAFWDDPLSLALSPRRRRRSVLFSSQTRTSSSSSTGTSTYRSKYQTLRDRLDPTYHDTYNKSRLMFQDNLLDQYLLQRQPSKQQPTNCHNQPQWLVATAGAMGAGKSHTLHELHQRQRFDLDRYLVVDPDIVRQQYLPEYSQFVQTHPHWAGEWTRKEAGLLCELLIWEGLRRSWNVLVDGSLRAMRTGTANILARSESTIPTTKWPYCTYLPMPIKCGTTSNNGPVQRDAWCRALSLKLPCNKYRSVCNNCRVWSM